MVWDVDTDAETRSDVEVVFEPLPPTTGGGLYVRYWDGAALIVLDPSLTGRRRIEALAHELVHHERAGCMGPGRVPHAWRPVRAREEGRVRRIVATRLVPLDRLADFCDRMADLGEGVDPWMVAEEFDVTEAVARQALDNLTRHERGP